MMGFLLRLQLSKTAMAMVNTGFCNNINGTISRFQMFSTSNAMTASSFSNDGNELRRKGDEEQSIVIEEDPNRQLLHPYNSRQQVKKSDRDGDDPFSDVKTFRNTMQAYGTELEKEKDPKKAEIGFFTKFFVLAMFALLAFICSRLEGGGRKKSNDDD